MRLFLFLLFISIPVMELAILIEVGGQIGVLLTILLVVLTAILGSFLIRKQGVDLLFRIRQRLSQDEAPVKEILTGFSLLIAGLCLLTPGFLTDSLGFLLLIPPLRDMLIDRIFVAKSTWQHFSASHSHNRNHHSRHHENIDIIDVNAEEIDNDQSPPSDDSDSPWRSNS